MLTTRLSIAMIGLVILTAGAVGWTSYRYLESATLPGEVKTVAAHAELLGHELAHQVRSCQADVLATRGSAALAGIMRARGAGGVDPDTGLSDSAWCDNLALGFSAELLAKPHYLQMRLIGLADGGREIVRVDRPASGDPIHIVADPDLQAQGTADYFQATVALAAGEVYISPIELDQENDVLKLPPLPVIRAATPVQSPDGGVFGILVINVDMHLALGVMRALHDPQGAVYLINPDGDFLVHPDETRTFGFDPQRRHRWQDEFPQLEAIANIVDPTVQQYRDASGAALVVAAAPIQLGQGSRVVAIETVPEKTLLAPVASVRSASIYAGLAAAVGALIIALIIARSLCKPLARMAAAVQAFARDETLDVPIEATGEIGMLARSFAHMARDVSEKTTALRAEITERRHAESELARHAERERMFIAVVESSDDAIIAMTLNGVITAWNPAAERVFGFTAQEAIGCDIGIIVPENRSDEPLAILDRVWRGERIEQLETVRRTKDNRLIAVTLSASPVRSPAHEIIGVSKIIHDLTARKQAEERFRLAVESCPSGIVVINRAGVIQLVNTATEQIFGYAREELVGRHVDVLVPAHRREEQARLRESYWSAPRMVRESQDHFGLRRDGTEFPIEIGLNPFNAPGGMQVLCTVVDITQRRRHEQEREQLAARLRQSEKMEAIGQLAGGVAHDFNNILTAVLGNTELATAELHANQPDHLIILEHLQQIEQSATWAAELTRQLLAFGSRQVAQPKPLNLNQTLSTMEKMLRRLIQENIELHFLPAAHLPSIMADASQIEQVLINLVVNARDAMPDGGSLVVETRSTTLDEQAATLDPELQPGDYVVLIVSDTGSGMDKSVQAHLFEPFFTTKPMGHGTGLGLATVYGIVRQSAGHIHVYSEVDQGSTFRIYFPAIGAASPAASKAEPGAAPQGTGTILLCEDDESVRHLMECLLEGAGYTVISASHGEEALHLAAVHNGAIDLLVTDVVMPGMHGRALAERLCAQQPSLQVLYVSGYTSNVIAHHGLLEGSVELIEKPFTRAALLQRVHRLLTAAGDRQLAAAGPR